MSRPGALERIAIRLARFVAGPERRAWLDAIETELDHLRTGRLDWALGSLVAAVKDRAARDWVTLVLFLALPCLTSAIVGPAFEAIKPIFRATGVPMNLVIPATYPLPLAIGIVLGAVHPWRRPVLVGALAFVIHQAAPSLYFRITRGWEAMFWGTDLRPLGIDGELMVVLMILGPLVFWCSGVWLGTRLREGRRDSGPSNR